MLQVHEQSNSFTDTLSRLPLKIFHIWTSYRF